MLCQVSFWWGSQKLLQGLVSHVLAAVLSIFNLFKLNELWPYYIVRTPPSPLKRGRGRKFWLLPLEGVEYEKLQKRGGGGGRNYGAGAGPFKRGSWHFSDLIFSTFIILHLEITFSFAKLCYVFEEKIFLSATIVLWKKGHSIVQNWTWKYPIN